jgi:hypothetical protein
LIYSFWVHFVTNTSLYFWKILLSFDTHKPYIVKKIIFDPYVLHGPNSVHLWGSGQGTKNVFKHILQTFATKWIFPSLTVVLIPISTHPSVHRQHVLAQLATADCLTTHHIMIVSLSRILLIREAGLISRSPVYNIVSLKRRF